MASPLYTAVMEWAPTARLETINVAEPLGIGAVPSRVVPSRNCTVPVAEAGDSAAVNVTGCPKLDGFAEEVNTTLEGALLTACARAAEVLVR